MAIDFSDMLSDEDDKIIDPRDIFFTLNRQAQFSFPRDIQTEVMKDWFILRDNTDNIIKLNVGSGKTLVGLLMLQSSLNEGKGPALFVTPDKQLADQVSKEAKALGISVVDDPKNALYASGECICVVNVHKLFNGRSVFGVGSSKINIGSVIIDDAHACVSTITEIFRISLPHIHDAYKKIFSTVAEDLKNYNEPRFLEISDSDPQGQIELPFWIWSSHQSDILNILHEHREDNELKFVYPLLKEILPQCRCVINGQSLEIEPHFPAVDLIQAFRLAKRRIYMTATLSDDSVLVTHFGATSDNLKKPITPSSSQSMGERMILMPQELNPDLSITDLRSMLKDLSTTQNVVVIVPSLKAASLWETDANQILIGDSVVPGIEKLRKDHVGLTVLVNRYDGIDLPGSACRVLAIFDLPEVNSFIDQADSDVLNGTAVNLKRQVERIEQGMGRGVRSNDDYCAVLLIGAKLTSRIRSPEGQSMLTEATKAQLVLSRKIAKKLKNPSTQEINGVINQCLNRDENWIKVSKNALIGLSPQDELKLDDSKVVMRAAFDYSRQGQDLKSVTVLDPAIDSSSNSQVKAWLLARKASFQHTLDADAAQKTLAVAHSMESNITKPMQGAFYKNLSPKTDHQATTIINNHNGRFIDSTMKKLFVNDLCNDLQFEIDTANKFEAAVNSLAWFIGVAGQRPEKEFGEGPDNLWALPNGKFLIIECKNGVSAGKGIIKKDAGQLGQSVEWFNKRYLASPYVPLMIHPDRYLGVSASMVTDMRVIIPNGLDKLRNNLRAFSDQLADPNISRNPQEIAKRLTQFELGAESFVNAFSTTIK